MYIYIFCITPIELHRAKFKFVIIYTKSLYCNQGVFGLIISSYYLFKKEIFNCLYVTTHFKSFK